jgi:purine-binding chemotaxis protein CheW
MADGDACRMVLFRVGTGMCAMPVQHVIETMRPQPVQALADTPHYIMGVSVIRGAPVPVVDLAALLHGRSEKPARMVTVEAGPHTAALAVGEIAGVVAIPPASLESLSPLLGEHSGAASSVGVIDTGVLFLLDGARMVPDDVWQALSAESMR